MRSDLARYIHRRVLEEQERQRRGVLEPDAPMRATSALAPDRGALWVLVNEVRLGHRWAALFKSNAPGAVVYSPEDVCEENLGDAEFIARAETFAREHTMIPAVQRRYPKGEAK